MTQEAFIVVNQARKAARRARRHLPLSGVEERADPSPAVEEMAVEEERQRRLRKRRWPPS